ncbi:Nmad3 family putative nucleotide modification protein [Haloplanus aerogenes]|uniref:Nucleotide modification associated domain-containing protein n=1 Tax=Haloplanus aerogenes TaxID=660522 RepID=A0A3M0E910_9EURY|nr:hypothetical protein [Haloplanus aerogenes]AZH24177.1 hypothetical protein DU502_01755 [Haloplanus aerogenes]RMB24203.1 hypothetical protein ATH50_1445 [Haloplanus aerogenes]
MSPQGRPRAIAINVGANTTLPGFRGPVRPDGRFAYVPIPEREPTAESVPTYGDLSFPLDVDVSEVADRRIHLDPEFAGVHGSTTYTYGDEHGVKAGPLSTLDSGDSLFFYATLSLRGDPADAPDFPPEWGAYLIGEFRVERAITGETYRGLVPADRDRFASNAHVKREDFDAKVLVAGSDESRLLDRAVPLSAPEAGATAGTLVTELSSDSGKGPWWRRVLRYDAEATERLRGVIDERQP